MPDSRSRGSGTRGRLDLGGEDLAEPPLELLHVGGLGPGQVEPDPPLLPVPPAQRPAHLEGEGRNVARGIQKIVKPKKGYR